MLRGVDWGAGGGRADGTGQLPSLLALGLASYFPGASRRENVACFMLVNRCREDEQLYVF